MDELKSFIEQNRDLFDVDEPSFGHLERFQQRLEMEQKQRRKWRTNYILKIAAMFVASITIGSLVVDCWVDNSARIIESKVADVDASVARDFVQRTSKYVKSKTNPEYEQAQDYYVSLVDNRLDQIRASENMDEEQKKELLKELSEMDELFVNLQKELKADPDNPALIDALVNHYQIKINVMNQIITNLNNIKQLNEQQNEKVDL